MVPNTIKTIVSMLLLSITDIDTAQNKVAADQRKGTGLEPGRRIVEENPYRPKNVKLGRRPVNCSTVVNN